MHSAIRAALSRYVCSIHSDGRMKLNCGAPVDGNSVLYANGQTITSENAASYSDMTVDADQSSSTDLIRRPGKPATYTEEGIREYWECPVCGTLYADAAGLKATTLEALTLPKLVRTDSLPQTGDTSRPAAWLALLGACCAGLWCVSRRRG